jgi:hypothetical protein
LDRNAIKGTPLEVKGNGERAAGFGECLFVSATTELGRKKLPEWSMATPDAADGAFVAHSGDRSEEGQSVCAAVRSVDLDGPDGIRFHAASCA